MAEARISTTSQFQPIYLLIEPFYGGSHRQLVDLLKTSFPQCTLLTLPATKWHWRARTSALHFAFHIPLEHDFQILFASSVLNLAELVALRPDLSKTRKILYFHENQLVYPVQKHQDRDFQYGYNQILSCLVADAIVFNSIYNQESFLNSVDPFLKLMPNRPKNLAARIRPKCQVLYFPIDFPLLPVNEAITGNHEKMENVEEIEPDGKADVGVASSGGCQMRTDAEKRVVARRFCAQNSSRHCASEIGISLDEFPKPDDHKCRKDQDRTSQQCAEASNLEIYTQSLDTTDRFDDCKSGIRKEQSTVEGELICGNANSDVVDTDIYESDGINEWTAANSKSKAVVTETERGIQNDQELFHLDTGLPSATGCTDGCHGSHARDVIEGNDREGLQSVDGHGGVSVEEVPRQRAPLHVRGSGHGPLHILWPHRWEHDKNPDEFFSTLFKLHDGGLDFKLSVLGENYQEVPAIFSEAKTKLQDHIIHWGYLTGKEDYHHVLTQADVVVSTANHEFFGVAMLEATHFGCYPMCPDRLVYPEIFPVEYLYRTTVQLMKKLKRFCRNPQAARCHNFQGNLCRYSWTRLEDDYKRLFRVDPT